MATLKSGSRRSKRLNLRATEKQKRLFEVVAEKKGVTVTDFILDCAYTKAQEILVDERHFTVSEDRWEAFSKALERPARANPRLQKLFGEKTVLERK